MRSSPCRLVALAASLAACSSSVSSGGGGEPDDTSTGSSASSTGSTATGGGDPMLPAGARWQRVFDGALHDRDVAFGIDVGSSGEVVAHGLETLSVGGGAVRSRLVLLDAGGSTLHDSIDEPAKSSQEGFIGWDVSIGDQGDIIATGTGWIEPGNSGYFMATLDVGSFAGGIDVASVPETVRTATELGADGSYALAVGHGGVTDLVGLYPSSDPLWSTVENVGQAVDVAVDGTGVVLVAGERIEPGGGDVVGSFVSAYADGVPLWLLIDQPAGAVVTGIDARADGSFYVSGSAGHAVLAAYAADGALLWEATHTHPGGFDAMGRGVGVTADGGVVLGGSYGSAQGAFLRRYASDGALVWHRDVYAMQESPFELWDLAIGPDGAIALAGSFRSDATDEDMAILLFDP